MSKFKVKDSGHHKQFSTGARRDTDENKGRYDLIDPYILYLDALLLEQGAKKYYDDNWRKGIKLSRFLSSASRHLNKLIEGWTDEPHAVQVRWNMMGFLWTKREIEQGRLPLDLADHRSTIIFKELKDLPKYAFGHDGSVWLKEGSADAPSIWLGKWTKLYPIAYNQSIIIELEDNNGNRKSHHISDLICRAFWGKRPIGKNLKWKDGNTENTQATNLYWG